MPTYVANVLGEGLHLIDEPISVEWHKATGCELAVGDDGVRVLYGDPDWVTCVVNATDENDAERRIIATWSNAITIDDLDLSILQEETHTFTLVVTVAGGTIKDARAYLTGVLEVGDGLERITNVDTHDANLLAEVN